MFQILSNFVENKQFFWLIFISVYIKAEKKRYFYERPLKVRHLESFLKVSQVVCVMGDKSTKPYRNSFGCWKP